MFKIGDFSKLSRVSVKALRYYDEIGLLEPHEIDRLTGYRYYTFDQLTRLHRILALKDLGLSLEQIGQLLHENLSADQLRGMLRLKQAEIQHHISEEQDRLVRVEAWLKQIELEDSMSTYAIVLKKLEPLVVASVRDTIPSYPEQGHLWDELAQAMRQRQAASNGPCFTLYHADEPEIIAEVCEPLKAPVEPQGRMQSYVLPGVELAACTIHHGPFITLTQAYETLIKWISDNGYRIAGPGREIYLQPPSVPGSQTDPETVTEVQFPVEKA
jgi:DNA-binding transcriptional MerR regulator